MPSEHQHGADKQDFESHEERMLHEKSMGLILSIKPERLETAKSWLAACNANNVPDKVTEHFYQEIQRLKNR